MFRPITLKPLNSLTLIETFSCLGTIEVTHQPAVRDVPGSISGFGKAFMFVLLLICLFFCPRHIICHEILQLYFAMLVHLVYLTYCTLCDRSEG